MRIEYVGVIFQSVEPNGRWAVLYDRQVLVQLHRSPCNGCVLFPPKDNCAHAFVCLCRLMDAVGFQARDGDGLWHSSTAVGACWGRA